MVDLARIGSAVEKLRGILRRIDRKGYKAYREIKGRYDFRGYTLFVDHVQGDPFATPSRLRARVPQDVAGFPPGLFSNESRQTGLEDYLIRQFSRSISKQVRGARGTGRSGEVGIIRCGQEILQRSAMVVNRDWVEVRFWAGLPAAGRSILGGEAEVMLLSEIPKVVNSSLIYSELEISELKRWVEVNEDQDTLRGSLQEKNLMAFLAEGSLLPRRSGVDDRPMDRRGAVLLRTPQSLEVSLRTPNHGSVHGLGIPRGVTLIVGGGYHGKSTLLRGIERGVYNHIPGDGRELAVTNPNAVKIRAEDGRKVEKVDISPFISNLPAGKDTRSFTTEDASGSTSQAASILEALEMGAELLLMDEDTSATNFMIRDNRMQHLVSKEKEPITPFVDKIELLYRDHSVSTILVLGGSGDYFDVADLVLMMDNYVPRDVTKEARVVAQDFRTGRTQEGGGRFGEIRDRWPRPESFDPRRGKKAVKIDARGLRQILFGRTLIDLSCVEQLIDMGQTRAIGDAIHYLARNCSDRKNLRDQIRSVMRDVHRKGLECLAPLRGEIRGDYAQFRGFELAAAINRMRTLKMRPE